MSVSGPVSAGTITGTVRDAITSGTIANMDLDLFDSAKNPIAAVNPVTNSSGVYSITSLAAGQYYLRVDPTVTDPYVDQYYPGVFLESQAAVINVAASGTVTINFSLERGATLSGHILNAVSGAAISDIDLDVYSSDRVIIGSIDATSALDGSYLLGRFPAGTYYVRGDPAPGQPYVLSYYDRKSSLASATPVQVSGIGNIGGIDIHLSPGGWISGTVANSNGTILLAGIDIDVFNSSGVFLTDYDGMTDANGAFIVSVPPGSYYIMADPTAEQQYVDTYYPDKPTFTGAELVSVSAGATASGINIRAPWGGTISGFVRNAGLAPLAGIKTVILDTNFNVVKGASGLSGADGSFLAGALVPGTYLVRADGDSANGYAFQYFDGKILRSQAQWVTVAQGQNTPNINFALDRAGWLSGVVRAGDTSLPLVQVSVDVYATSGEQIGALHEKTASDGTFKFGRVPAGSYLVKADPGGLYSYYPQYFLHAFIAASANPIPVTALNTTAGAHFELVSRQTGVSDEEVRPDMISVSPNPFRAQMRLRFTLARSSMVEASVYDVAGRRIEELVLPQFMPAGTHDVIWDGLDNAERRVAKGLYFVRLARGNSIVVRQLVRD
jgi:flagellar hook capping protein FlgD